MELQSQWSTATFETTAIEENLEATFDTNAGKVVICYEYGSTSNAIIGTVSDTDITFGTAATFSSNDTRENLIAYDSNVNKPVVFYRCRRLFKNESRAFDGKWNLVFCWDGHCVGNSGLR